MGKLILLVDDSATVKQLVSLAFRDEGIELVSATTLSAARQSLNERTPDLILVDLSLPDGDTLTFIREVRAGADTSRTPVVLLVPVSASFDLERVRRAGADAVLTKPFESMTLLVETVKNISSRRSRLPEPAPLGNKTAEFLLDEAGLSDSILELDDSNEWSGLNVSQQSALLMSLPPDFVEELADRVAELLLTRLRSAVGDGSLPEAVKAVVELMTGKTAIVDSSLARDVDEADENPDIKV